MAKAQAEEENHWPGFVDALSTIVMVVTFLLIILAIAIFVLSLKVVDVVVDTEKQVTTTSNMEESKIIEVVETEPELKILETASLIIKSKERLSLKYYGNTIDIDPMAVDEVSKFLASGVTDEGVALRINSYFDGSEGGYTKRQRISYYRAMSVRNLLIEQGYSGERVQVHVKMAPDSTANDRVDIVRVPLQKSAETE